jgi:16S rRNA (uracil1498-N3)-methyltransferase
LHTFYAPILPPNGGPVLLEDEEARHLKVRRLRPGEGVRLIDGHGGFAIGRYDSGVTVSAEARLEEPPPATQLVLLQAFLPAEKLDWAIQKATELGADRIIFYRAERSVAKRDKPERWERLVRESSKQCGRARFPAVFAVDSLSEAVSKAACERLWLCDGAGSRPGMDGAPATAGIIVGPEGGLTDAEKATAVSAGAVMVRLGPWTLRSETVSSAGLALLQYAYGSPNP